MENVERTQYHAALAITGTWQGSSQSKLYEELRWDPTAIGAVSFRFTRLKTDFCIDVITQILFTK